MARWAHARFDRDLFWDLFSLSEETYYGCLSDWKWYIGSDSLRISGHRLYHIVICIYVLVYMHKYWALETHVQLSFRIEQMSVCLSVHISANVHVNERLSHAVCVRARAYACDVQSRRCTLPCPQWRAQNVQKPTRTHIVRKIVHTHTIFQLQKVKVSVGSEARVCLPYMFSTDAGLTVSAS